MSKATLESIKKGQELYYIRASDSTLLHKVLVEGITADHYLVRFSAKKVYDIKKHKRSILNFYHTRAAAVKECKRIITDDYNKALSRLEEQYAINIEKAGRYPIFWNNES